MRDARAYWLEIVLPTIEDFERNFTSRRHAFLACAAMVHTVDYIAFENGRPNKTAASRVRRAYGKESTEFLLVDRVAHAFKHVHSDGRPTDEGGDRVTRDDVAQVLEYRAGEIWRPADVAARMKSVPVSVLTANGWTDLRATIRLAAFFLAEKLSFNDDAPQENTSPTSGD
jgi:hypothetical protein